MKTEKGDPIKRLEVDDYSCTHVTTHGVACVGVVQGSLMFHVRVLSPRKRLSTHVLSLAGFVKPSFKRETQKCFLEN